MSPQTILVTGASSGFGRALVDQILAAGNIAIATVRKPSALADIAGHERLFILELDITNPEQRVAAFAAIRAKYGRLDVAINNAGIVGDVGELEVIPMDRAKKCFDTNLWSTFEMSRLAVEHFRGVNVPQGGRLITVSSFVGYQNPPGSAVYNASKAALESLMSSYAAELDPAWNIKATLVEPGQYATSVLNPAATVVHPAHPAYSNPALPVNAVRAYISSMGSGDFKPKDPADAARVILKVAAMRAEDVPARQPIGNDAVALITAGCEKVIKEMESGKALAAEGERPE